MIKQVLKASVGYVVAGLLLLLTSFSAVAEPDIFYFHNDHLGTPQVVTDQDQNVVWKANYTPFGEADIVVEDIEMNIRFPGQYYDKETGYHYNYYRTYDPSMGRYIQSDPIGLNGGLNTYGYVRGNPTGYSDPFGLRDKKYDPSKHKPRTVQPPSADDEEYNCHSDAWHGGQGDPTDPSNPWTEISILGWTIGWGGSPRWDNSAYDDMKDAKRVFDSEPTKVGDIVVYGADIDGNGKLEDLPGKKYEIDHSATVVEVDSDGYATYVRSKEGVLPTAYHHPRKQRDTYGKTTEYYRK